MTTEGENRPSDIPKLIEHLKSGERPLDQFLAQAVDQLYNSGQYRLALVQGPRELNPLRALDCLRLVCVRGDRLASYVVSFTANKQKQRRQLDTLLAETHKLPLNQRHLGAVGYLEDMALDSLRRQQLLMVAGMTLSTVMATEQGRVEVNYPKPFMDLLPLPDLYRQDLGLALAIYFLRKVPFGSGTISFPLPSH